MVGALDRRSIVPTWRQRSERDCLPPPHAPRSDEPEKGVSTGPHFDISSTSELNSATHRSRISNCARPSIRIFDRIQASDRLRIAYSPTDQVSQTRRLICIRGRTEHSSHPQPASSVDSYSRHQLAAYCRPKSTQLRSKSRVDSGQNEGTPEAYSAISSSRPFTTVQPAPTVTPVGSNLQGAQTTATLTKISRNKY